MFLVSFDFLEWQKQFISRLKSLEISWTRTDVWALENFRKILKSFLCLTMNLKKNRKSINISSMNEIVPKRVFVLIFRFFYYQFLFNIWRTHMILNKNSLIHASCLPACRNIRFWDQGFNSEVEWMNQIMSAKEEKNTFIVLIVNNYRSVIRSLSS